MVLNYSQASLDESRRALAEALREFVWPNRKPRREPVKAQPPPCKPLSLAARAKADKWNEPMPWPKEYSRGK